MLMIATLPGCVVWKSDYDELKAQNQQLQADLTNTRQQVTRLQGAIKYVANSDLLFAAGSWEMRPQGKQIIADFAKKLAPSQENRLLVDGHTDNAPIGPALQRLGIPSNQVLSQKRADVVREFLISQGVRPDLVTAHGYGEADPIASNDTASGRAQNRRVELTLGGPGR